METWLTQAFKDWLSGRAYVAGPKGKQRFYLKPLDRFGKPYSGTGKTVAPWSSAIIKKYGGYSAQFHKDAHDWQSSMNAKAQGRKKNPLLSDAYAAGREFANAKVDGRVPRFSSFEDWWKEKGRYAGNVGQTFDKSDAKDMWVDGMNSLRLKARAKGCKKNPHQSWNQNGWYISYTDNSAGLELSGWKNSFADTFKFFAKSFKSAPKDYALYTEGDKYVGGKYARKEETQIGRADGKAAAKKLLFDAAEHQLGFRPDPKKAGGEIEKRNFMRNPTIVYEDGPYWVTVTKVGKNQTPTYEVFKNEGVASKKVASIGVSFGMERVKQAIETHSKSSVALKNTLKDLGIKPTHKAVYEWFQEEQKNPSLSSIAASTRKAEVGSREEPLLWVARGLELYKANGFWWCRSASPSADPWARRWMRNVDPAFSQEIAEGLTEQKKKNPSLDSIKSSVSSAAKAAWSSTKRAAKAAKGALRSLTPRGRRSKKALKRLTDFDKMPAKSGLRKKVLGSASIRRTGRNPRATVEPWMYKTYLVVARPSYGGKLNRAYVLKNGSITQETLASFDSPTGPDGYVRMVYSIGKGSNRRHSYPFLVFNLGKVREMERGLPKPLAEVTQEDYDQLMKWFDQEDQKQNPSKVRRNPEATASAAYEMFHGKPSSRVVEYHQPVHRHSNLWELGTLVEIKLDTFPTGPKKLQRSVTIQAPDSGTDPLKKLRKQVRLTASEDCKQLYFTGGDQAIDLKKLGFKAADIHDSVLIGKVKEITYRTKKDFDKFKTLDYYHGLGEVTKVLPVLTYNPRDRRMYLSGGQYQIKREGIVN